MEGVGVGSVENQIPRVTHYIPYSNPLSKSTNTIIVEISFRGSWPRGGSCAGVGSVFRGGVGRGGSGLRLRRSSIAGVLRLRIGRMSRRSLPTHVVSINGDPDLWLLGRENGEETCMTKSTRPVEFMAFSFSDS